MQVGAVNALNDHKVQSFGELKITKRGQKFLDNYFSDAVNKTKLQSKIGLLKNKLANTKQFDLVIDAVNNEALFEMRDKFCPKMSSEGPLYPAELHPFKKTLIAAGIDLLDPGDWFYYLLKFRSYNDAHKAFKTLKSHMKKNESEENLLSKIDWSADSVEILDKSFSYNGCKDYNI